MSGELRSFQGAEQGPWAAAGAIQAELGTHGRYPPQKHIKEHHEEVRERPCPHPGCNKVFMVDRYLQRHVKLIHTGACRPRAGLQGCILVPPACLLYSVAVQLSWSECGLAAEISQCLSGSLLCSDFIIALVNDMPLGLEN